MEKAYVLSTVEMGSEKEVLNTLNEIPDVKGVYQIYGVYDFILEVEAETLQELKDLIINRIRSIKEIKTTLTFICLN